MHERCGSLWSFFSDGPLASSDGCGSFFIFFNAPHNVTCTGELPEWFPGSVPGLHRTAQDAKKPSTCSGSRAFRISSDVLESPSGGEGGIQV